MTQNLFCEGRLIADELAKLAYFGGEFEGTAGSFAAPEGNGGWLAMGVFDENSAGARFDAADSPTGVAEKHDVARV